MMILYSKLIGTPVADLASQSKIGTVADFIFSDSDLSIAAIVVEIGLPLLTKQKVVAAADFIDISKEGIVINDAESIVEIRDLSRIKKLYEQKYFGINQKVVTKSGTYIGHVYDILFDSKSSTIKKFYVKKMFSERIIPVTAVISFEGKLITIKDDKPYVFVPSVETAID